MGRKEEEETNAALTSVNYRSLLTSSQEAEDEEDKKEAVTSEKYHHQPPYKTLASVCYRIGHPGILQGQARQDLYRAAVREKVEFVLIAMSCRKTNPCAWSSNVNPSFSTSQPFRQASAF